MYMDYVLLAFGADLVYLLMCLPLCDILDFHHSDANNLTSDFVEAQCFHPASLIRKIVFESKGGHG